MTHRVLNRIKDKIITIFIEEYGFCGVADAPNVAMINSGKGTDDFVVKIEDKSVTNTVKEASHGQS